MFNKISMILLLAVFPLLNACGQVVPGPIEANVRGRVIMLDEKVEVSRGERIALDGTYLSFEFDVGTQGKFVDGSTQKTAQFTWFENIGTTRTTFKLIKDSETSTVIRTPADGNYRFSLVDIDIEDQMATILLEKIPYERGG